jgi:hypothetical protein
MVMKIAVYQIEKITPEDEKQYNEFCDVLCLPSLKYGYAEFIGSLSHWITMKELKKSKRIYSRYYDRVEKVWIDGVVLLNSDKKYFAQI